jgi:seryl-tRNA synthetase
MLDIRFIRENADLVAKKSEQKNYKVNIPRLLELDSQKKELSSEIERVRASRNELAGQLKGGQPSPEKIQKGKEFKEQLANLESKLQPIGEEFIKLLKEVPNMPLDDVPVGASEAENVVAKEWGKKPQLDFKPKTHWEIGEARGFIDKERASKVAGARFAYIKGDLVRLQFALIQFALDTLTSEEMIKKIVQNAGLKVATKPFVPVLPPAMIKTDVFEAMDRLEPRDDRYKVGTDEDDLWLQGSAEHTLGSMYMNEILSATELPIRYLGYATSFRREAGTYGKDTEGIIRLHQFDKLEMESFTLPEDGLNEHLLMIAIQEYLMQQLMLPYHVLKKCTADIGKPNVSGVDVEAWLPGNERYLETHTADYMTDYQSRRLQTRVKTDKGTVFVHTNDATAFPQRPLIAIIENYQTKDGTVRVPDVLQPYMGGKTEI